MSSRCLQHIFSQLKLSSHRYSKLPLSPKTPWKMIWEIVLAWQFTEEVCKLLTRFILMYISHKLNVHALHYFFSEVHHKIMAKSFFCDFGFMDSNTVLGRGAQNNIWEASTVSPQAMGKPLALVQHDYDNPCNLVFHADLCEKLLENLILQRFNKSKTGLTGSRNAPISCFQLFVFRQYTPLCCMCFLCQI